MFSDFAIQYMLEKRCKNNKNEYARELGISSQEMMRLLKRVKKGDGSPRLVNMTLEALAQHPDLLREAAMQYEPSGDNNLQYPRTCHYSTDMERALSYVNDRSEYIAHEKRVDYMNKCAREFFRAMESVYCGRNQDHFPACASYCQSDKRAAASRPCLLVAKLSELLAKKMRHP